MCSKLISHAMLAHITAQNFYPFRFTIIVSCALIIAYYFIPLSLFFSEEVLLWGLLVFNTIGMLSNIILAYFQFIIIVAYELSNILGIRVFLVKKVLLII